MTLTQIEMVFRALADPTRLRLLQVLRGGEFCVSDVIAVLRVPQAKTSRHLTYLRRAGLVECRQQGLWSFYRLSAPRTVFHRKLWECLERCSGEVPDLTADARRAMRIKQTGGCCPGLARNGSSSPHRQARQVSLRRSSCARV